jgi:hypothetical protein
MSLTVVTSFEMEQRRTLIFLIWQRLQAGVYAAI